jgi:hypothetical protein
MSTFLLRIHIKIITVSGQSSTPSPQGHDAERSYGRRSPQENSFAPHFPRLAGNPCAFYRAHSASASRAIPLSCNYSVFLQHRIWYIFSGNTSGRTVIRTERKTYHVMPQKPFYRKNPSTSSHADRRLPPRYGVSRRDTTQGH